MSASADPRTTFTRCNKTIAIFKEAICNVSTTSFSRFMDFFRISYSRKEYFSKEKMFMIIIIFVLQDLLLLLIRLDCP